MPTEYIDNDPNPNDANKPGLSYSYFLGKDLSSPNPSQVAVGVYDFSSTYACTFQHGIPEADGGIAFSLSSDEIANFTKLWWDGSSASWSSDVEYNEVRGSESFKLIIAGDEYRIIKREAFGDEDQQHLIVAKTKTGGSKRGALISHANYTTVVTIFDEDKGYPEGSASVKLQQYSQAILAAGY